MSAIVAHALIPRKSWEVLKDSEGIMSPAIDE